MTINCQDIIDLCTRNYIYSGENKYDIIRINIKLINTK